MGEFRYIAYGIEILHINHEAKTITKELSLLSVRKFRSVRGCILSLLPSISLLL
ncbi:unnamed protein product [Phaeothamnion confervicola]